MYPWFYDLLENDKAILFGENGKVGERDKMGDSLALVHVVKSPYGPPLVIE